jgi:Dienelactone hydrolase family
MHTNDSLAGFTKSSVTELGQTREVYRIGDSGPCVLVCHEIPGITPAVADFCRHVAAQGFQVSCPVLFGIPGGPKNGKTIAKERVNHRRLLIGSEHLEKPNMFAAVDLGLESSACVSPVDSPLPSLPIPTC